MDFEAAAQAILMETLREVRRLRPQSLWGVAPFPDCYNSGPLQLLSNYTGRCPAAEMALNDELMWLWKRSTAIYPTLMMDKFPPGSKGPWLYSSNQIREALRVAALAGTAYDLPVFPLVRTVYASTNAYLSEVSNMTVAESLLVPSLSLALHSCHAGTQSRVWSKLQPVILILYIFVKINKIEHK